MSIEYEIDDEQEIVFAQGRGVLTHEDIFSYQRDVWSRPQLAGFDELVDMRYVQRIDPPTGERIKALATLSASMDPRPASKLAIVADDDLAFGLGKMYQARRRLDERSTKQVAVFRTMKPALEWLGIDMVGGAMEAG